MAFRSGTKILSEHTGGLLGSELLAGAYADEITRLQAKSSLSSLLPRAPEGILQCRRTESPLSSTLNQ